MLLRPLRFPLLATATAIATATATGISLGVGAGPWTWGPAALAQSQAGAEISPALGVEQARAAANRILKAVKSRDANLRYSQFSDELKAVSSPAMVATSMRTQPRLLSWTLLSVQGGLRDTTVEASLTTSRGQQDLFMVINGQGKLTGYHLDLTDEAPSLIAQKFVTALSDGHFISARSYLSLPLQNEIGADRLQIRWQQLQQQTGSFVRIRKIVEAESTGDERLVLVNTEFNRLSDSLYVILNANNEITGIDFPSEPIAPQPVR
ncbi:MAG: DUF3887 domain-containing protein [Cyanobium sp.]